MPKYNYKKDALTDYFKGKLSAKELDKIARNDFKSGIATKKELSNFLSNSASDFTSCNPYYLCFCYANFIKLNVAELGWSFEPTTFESPSINV